MYSTYSNPAYKEQRKNGKMEIGKQKGRETYGSSRLISSELIKNGMQIRERKAKCRGKAKCRELPVFLKALNRAAVQLAMELTFNSNGN